MPATFSPDPDRAAREADRDARRALHRDRAGRRARRRRPRGRVSINVRLGADATLSGPPGPR